jgi:plastocyanin domain-containing protein
MVLLPAFNKSARLPEGQTVPIEFLPKERGEFEFACQIGMLRGKVIVE